MNKELAHSLSGSNFQVTAYTRLNTDVISPAAILDFAAKAIKDTGIEEGQINLTEYFAVMSGAIKSGIPDVYKRQCKSSESVCKSYR